MNRYGKPSLVLVGSCALLLFAIQSGCGGSSEETTDVSTDGALRTVTAAPGVDRTSEAPTSAVDSFVATDDESKTALPQSGDAPSPTENRVSLRETREAAAGPAAGTDPAEARAAGGFQLLPGEELWVIARSETQVASSGQESPGCGALMATLPDQSTVPVPLQRTKVEGVIDGYIASVNVTQQFHNPFDSKIEAVYVFPLPQNAAVNEFIMTVGERRIRGIIREREEAEEIYQQARSQGHVASLMTQERPNIFTQKVANIEPGKQIEIDIRYFNTLRYEDGSYEFVFPMVVGPRFNPPHTSDGIGAVARGQRNASGQATEIEYLSAAERSGHDIELAVTLNTGVEVQHLASLNHAVHIEQESKRRHRVVLSPEDAIPNRDFVLRFQVAGDQINSALMTHADKNGQYFTMMLYPPSDLRTLERSPVEMVFVLDCSGSMRGKPLQQAKAAVAHTLQSLTPRDSFQIIRFSSNASQLGSSPVVATPKNVQRGLSYLRGLDGSGGTMMVEGVKAALSFPHDEGRYRLVTFMTDGYIGNEQEILSVMNQHLGASRVFSFGVGSSPNRYLMDRMAIVGRGAVAYLSLHDDAVAIMDDFNQRVSHPAMTDLSIDWGRMQVSDVYPQSLPDLIVGRPVIVTGRFEGDPSTVRINGSVSHMASSFDVVIDAEESTQPHAGIAAVWARMKIADLMLETARKPESAPILKSEVLQTALNHNLMSAFTAFVAVDSLSQTDGEFGTTVAIPVNVPDGVRYETTVGGSRE